MTAIMGGVLTGLVVAGMSSEHAASSTDLLLMLAAGLLLGIGMRAARRVPGQRRACGVGRHPRHWLPRALVFMLAGVASMALVQVATA